MPAKRDAAAEDAAKPIWANLFFIDTLQKTHWHGSVLVHGIPPLGAYFELHEDSDLDPDISMFGKVTMIRYGPTTDGSFKPTIVVTVERG